MAASLQVYIHELLLLANENTTENILVTLSN